MPHFSPRELQVASRLAEAESNTEIADALNISRERVKDVVSNLLKKAKVRDRHRFGVWVWRLRLIASWQSLPSRKPVQYK